MSLRVRVILAAVCAALAIALVGGYAASVRSQASAQREDALERYGGETTLVCVTTSAVARGETFSESNVSTAEWLVDLLPEGALTDASLVLGRPAACAMAANTPIGEVNVDTQASPIDVPEGRSAVSVPCSAESAVGGALAAGSLVDVYVVSDGSAHLLSQGVQVLQTSSGSTGANLSWVTIAVEPSQVEAIVASSSLQKLYFVLPSESVAAASSQSEATLAESEAGDAAGSDGTADEGSSDGAAAPGTDGSATPSEGMAADGASADVSAGE